AQRPQDRVCDGVAKGIPVRVADRAPVVGEPYAPQDQRPAIPSGGQRLKPVEVITVPYPEVWARWMNARGGLRRRVWHVPSLAAGGKARPSDGIGCTVDGYCRSIQ